MTSRRARKNQNDHAQAVESIKRGEGLATVTPLATKRKPERFIVSKTNNSHYWAWRCLNGPCDAGTSHNVTQNTAITMAEMHARECEHVMVSS